MIRRLPRWLGSLLYVITYPGIWLALAGSRRSYILVIHNKQVLATKSWFEWHHPWRLPGGGIKRGESPLDAAVRELYEEIGIQVPAAACKPLVTAQRARRIPYTFWVYQCQVTQPGSIQLGGDSITAQYLSIDRLHTEPKAQEIQYILPLVKSDSGLL